jgi:hypothetical protein
MKTFLIAIYTFIVIANSLLAQTTDLKQNKKFSLKGTTLVYNSNLSSDPDRNYITFDDAKVFKKYLDENNIKTLRLTSEGGQQGASLDIKDLVLEHELNTEAKGECSSACSIIFVAGQKRKLIGKAKLGFHTTFTRIEDFEKRKKVVEGYDERLDYENTIAYFQRLASVEEIVFFQMQGIDIYFALRVLRVHPLDMWYPERKELIKYGVVK